MAELFIAIKDQARVWWHSLGFYLSSHFVSIEIDAHTWCRIMTCTDAGKSALMHCLPVLIGEAEPFDPDCGCGFRCGSIPITADAFHPLSRHISAMPGKLSQSLQEWSATMETNRHRFSKKQILHRTNSTDKKDLVRNKSAQSLLRKSTMSSRHKWNLTFACRGFFQEIAKCSLRS